MLINCIQPIKTINLLCDGLQKNKNVKEKVIQLFKEKYGEHGSVECKYWKWKYYVPYLHEIIGVKSFHIYIYTLYII